MIREIEQLDARAYRPGRKAMPCRIDRSVLDAGGPERGRPVAQPERRQLQVVAGVAGEDESCVDPARVLVERLQHLRSQRHRRRRSDLLHGFVRPCEWTRSMARAFALSTSYHSSASASSGRMPVPTRKNGSAL